MSKFQQIFRGLVAKRPVLFSLLCLLLLATGITGTWAWSSGRQSAINDGQVQTTKRTVQLLKLERDTAQETQPTSLSPAPTLPSMKSLSKTPKFMSRWVRLGPPMQTGG